MQRSSNLGVASSFFLSPGKFPSKLAGDCQALGLLSHGVSPGFLPARWAADSRGRILDGPEPSPEADPSPVLTRPRGLPLPA